MSESALIAYQNPQGLYDLFWSHNGADDLYLRPYLAEVATGDRQRTLPNVDPKLPEGIEESSRFNLADTLKVAIDPNPVLKNVPRSEVGLNTDFLAYECLYVVSGGFVSVYYPMWTFPGIISALREMYELEVYPPQIRAGSSSDSLDHAEPIVTFSGDDFSSNTFRDIRYRSFLNLHHMGIFQTTSGIVNDATTDHDLREATLEKEERVRIRPVTTENYFEPFRVGNGVFIELTQLPVDEAPTYAKAVTNESAALRVDAAIEMEEAAEGAPDSELIEKYEIELLRMACKHFGLLIAPGEIQPYDSDIQSTVESLIPDKRVTGEEYRVVDTDGQSALFNPLNQSGKIGAVNPDRFSSDDVEIVALEKTPEDYIGVANSLTDGDIVIADLDTTDVPAHVRSIHLIQKVLFAKATVENSPEFVKKAYGEEVEPNIKQKAAPAVRKELHSEFETISDIKFPVGEFQVTHDPEGNIWSALESGKFGEEVYGQFLHRTGRPREVLLFNAASEPFWFGLFFTSARSGIASYWRSQYDVEY